MLIGIRGTEKIRLPKSAGLEVSLALCSKSLRSMKIFLNVKLGFSRWQLWSRSLPSGCILALTTAIGMESPHINIQSTLSRCAANTVLLILCTCRVGCAPPTPGHAYTSCWPACPHCAAPRCSWGTQWPRSPCTAGGTKPTSESEKTPKAHKQVTRLCTPKSGL